MGGEDSSLPHHIAGFLAFGLAPNFLLGIGSLQPPDFTGLANAPTARTIAMFSRNRFRQSDWTPSQGDRKIFIESPKEAAEVAAPSNV
jgi:hypothetical protein